jgi:uncharacterized coiled-coil protein SlyX
MNSTDEASQRLERLEAHIAHLEHHIDQLNEVLIEQGKTVEQLKKQLQRQATTLDSIELERVKSINPKPPHSQV